MYAGLISLKYWKVVVHTHCLNRSPIGSQLISSNALAPICTLSDHKIVRLRIAQNVEIGGGSWIFYNTLLKDDIFVKIMTDKLVQSLTYRDSFIDASSFWDYIKQYVKSEARMYAIRRANERRTEKVIRKNEIGE